jgi:hypothetical protein
MKIICAAFFLLLLIGASRPIFAQNAAANVVIVDPTKTVKPQLISDEEKYLVKSLLPAVRRIWDKDVCEETFSITGGAAAGAFTKAGARQKAFLYEFCQTENAFANNGIVVLEDGRVVAHFVYEGAQTAGLDALPDINGNGRDELLITNYGGMHQGISATGIDVLEFSNGAMAISEIGATQIDYDASGASEDGKGAVYSYKISVARGAQPVFYREKFVPRGKIWRKVAAAQKAEMFRLDYKYIAVK